MTIIRNYLTFWVGLDCPARTAAAAVALSMAARLRLTCSRELGGDTLGRFWMITYENFSSEDLRMMPLYTYVKVDVVIVVFYVMNDVKKQNNR